MESTQELIDVLRSYADDGYVRTHCESCWRWHPRCLATRAADELERLLRSERASA